METDSEVATAGAISQQEVAEAFSAALSDYFADCRTRVPAFVNRHFRYPGAWHINRQAWGGDLLRAPVNLFWAPFFVLAMVAAWLCHRLGAKKLSRLLAGTPGGFTTRVQQHIATLIERDLLQRSDGEDRLLQLAKERIGLLLEAEAGNPPANQTDQQEQLLRDALKQYALARTASADISNSVFSTLLGAFAFKKFTPGGMAVGVYLAGLVAEWIAVEHFVLGENLGRLYYQWFPPEPSLAMTVGSVAATLFTLAIVASFSGLLTDPLQSWTGLHRRRLIRLLDSLEQDYRAAEKRSGSFRPKDPYLARLLDSIDALRSPWL
ncbi:hypothetical protein F6455_01475 [Proteobacteria bacterium 005FR1]|nr:hypothetical protein [Proteobacteria bacterium 005FR1]